MKFPSLKHCRDYNVTWFEHCWRSLRWVLELQKATICLTIHSFCPWLLEKSASTIIFKTAIEMENCAQRKVK